MEQESGEIDIKITKHLLTTKYKNSVYSLQEVILYGECSQKVWI